VPMWYLPAVRLAWWKRLQHPDVVPRDGPSLSTWWLKPGSGGGKQ
jgi:microcin C transport system substrate-binding protein